MPSDVESALKRVARKYLKSGKLKGKGNAKERMSHFVYGRMTNMQKSGQIAPWRKLK